MIGTTQALFRQNIKDVLPSALTSHRSWSIVRAVVTSVCTLWGGRIVLTLKLRRTFWDTPAARDLPNRPATAVCIN
jgi:hypothetical protein